MSTVRILNKIQTGVQSKLKGHGLFRKAAIIAGGTVSSQIIESLVAPLTTRLYSPSDFGTLGVFVSVLSLILVISSLRYELAIPLPECDIEAFNLLAFAIVVLLFFSTLTGVFVLVFEDYIVQWTNTPAIKPYLWLLPLAVFGGGGYHVFSYWSIRRKEYTRLAKSKLSRGLGRALAHVSLGVLGLAPSGLIAGEIVGQFGGTGTLIKQVFNDDKSFIETLEFDRIRSVAKRYGSFAILFSFSSLLNSAGLQLPPLIFAGIYNVEIVGWFALVQRVLAIPISLIGSSVNQVYFGEAAKLVNKEPRKVRAMFLGTMKKLALLAIGPSILLLLTGPWLFSIVFGEAWREAGIYAQILAPVFFLRFTVAPTSLFSVLERKDLSVIWNIVRFFLVLLSFFVVVWGEFSATTAVALYSVSMIIVYTLLFYMSYLAINMNIRRVENEG